MSLSYKIIYQLKRRYASWEKMRHAEYVRSKIVEDGGVVGAGGTIGRDVNITGRRQLVLGSNVHIGSGAFIRADGGLSIGDNTIISRNLLLYTMNHQFEGDLLPFDSSASNKPVSIGPNVWIGMNVIICPGTEVGEGAVIGMGTVLFGKIPPLAVVGTSDWKVIKQRDADRYHDLKDKSAIAREDGLPLN